MPLALVSIQLYLKQWTLASLCRPPHIQHRPDAPESLLNRIQIQPGQVVSMALSKRNHCLMTLLAFADGESVSEEQYFGDTLYSPMPLSMSVKLAHIGPGESFMAPSSGGMEPSKLPQITV